MSLITYKNNAIHPGIYNLLNDIFGDEIPTYRRLINTNTVPAVNVRESDKSFELELAIPGMEKKDINIEVEEDVLIVSSARQEEKKEEDKNFKRREFHYNAFKRSFSLPEDVEGDKIEAKYENGVLRINIPKREMQAKLKKMVEVA